MNRISLDARGGQWLADLASWERESAPDNNEQMERLRRNLRLAVQLRCRTGRMVVCLNMMDEARRRPDSRG